MHTMYDEIKDKKLKIDKILKKKKHLCLFDLTFNDQDLFKLYVRLDYVKTSNVFKVVWVNLGQMTSKKTEDWINYNLIYPKEVERFKEIIAKNGISKDYIDKDKVNAKCVINSYITDYEYNKKTFEFKRYIPKCWEFLADALYILFEAMPKYLHVEFQILIEKLIQPQKNTIFVRDNKKDNLDDLFDDKTIATGLALHKVGAVAYIEKTNNVTYSVVRAMENYLVSVYDLKETKEMQLSCTCQNHGFCEHMYAALTAMNNKEEKKFFKIAKVDDDKSLLDNINNFEYFLCPGLFEGNFVVIQGDNYQLLPIIVNDKLQFKIVEDDKDKSLEKALKEYLKSINYKDNK